jgi:Holliday junction DNA helicase RuvB
MYSEEEMRLIVGRSAKILGLGPDDQAKQEIAIRARQTPRTANYYLKRVRDYAQVHEKEIDRDVVTRALTLLGIDEIGLTESDRAYLYVLYEKFGGGPTGIKTLSAALNEEEATLEEVIEPYLLRQGLIEKTPRGREITPQGKQHIGA